MNWWRRLRRWLAWRLFADVLSAVQDEAYDTAYDAGHMDGEWAAWGAMRDHAVRVREDIEREAGLS